jgi:uroporphyrinogen decarboxylase
MSTHARKKARRLSLALDHREPDRVPISDFFWSGFLERCREQWGSDFDPYRFFDLDYVVVTPNMDPRIQPFEILHETEDEVVVRTGFGAVIRRSGKLPMPYFEDFAVHEPAGMARFELGDPTDPRRFFEGGDDQLNGVGDTLTRDLPPWNDRVNAYVEDLAVFGSVCEPYEYLWRIIGSHHALLWMVSEGELFEAFVHRVGAFLLAFAEAQIQAGAGRLTGMYIWGDVAYRNGMFFSPRQWRALFKPYVKALIDLCHAHDLLAIYHGCGNARPILDDLAELGLDGYNPVEAKADLDVVMLKEAYRGKLAFAGNIDVRVLERGDPDEIRAEVLYKLQAAQGGGYVVQSDHSVSSAVSPDSYRLLVDTVREYGDYPLRLGEGS